MSIFELFVLAVGLSMDAFAVSICKGLSLGKIKLKHMCIAGAWFGIFQAIMPLIGFFLGRFFTDIVTKFSHWIAFALLYLIGISMIKEAFEKKDVNASITVKSMFMLAIATSIDALAVGVSFAFLKVNILLAVLIIGIITFILSAIGIKIGSLFGSKYKKPSEIVGGIILIFIALKTLFQGLGII